MLQKILETIERKAQRLQGKGGGGESIAAEVRAALHFIPPQATVFDVGANKGLWSRALLQRSENRVTSIHAFEPSQVNIDAISAINDPRITIVSKAVSSSSGRATLYSDSPGSGLASLTKRDLDFLNIDMTLREHIDVITLDAYAEECGIDRIDFLKLDIEGHELDAMHGADRLFRAGCIRALAFEFGGCNIDTRTYFKDFYNFLTPLGFRIWRITPFGKPFSITRYRESHEVPRTTNFIAAL